MIPGDVVLIPLPQTGGGPPKLRPALVLASLPGPFQNVLICGLTTQLHQIEPDWDERIETSDADFPRTGLHRESTAALSYLYSADANDIVGIIGQVDPTRLARLRSRLAARLKI